MRVDSGGNPYVAMYYQAWVLVLNGQGIPIGQVLLPGRDEGHNLLCTSMAKLVESRLRPGAYLVADGADHCPEYLAHVRSPANGYLSVPFGEGVELSMRIN